MKEFAKKDFNKKGGKEYGAKASKDLVSALNKVMNSCKFNGQHEAVLSVSNSGRIQDVFFKKIPREEACAKRILLGLQLPAPPFETFRFPLTIK